MTLSRTLLLLIIVLTLYGCDEKYSPEVSAIAHAGGGINGKTYTNSFKALNHNYDRGYELFEIDFVWTNDGHLVCLHDWDRTPKWLLDYHGEEPLSLAEFNQLEHPELKFKPCTLDSLNQWLIHHPKAFVVTDIKEANIKGLELIKNKIKDAESRVIPQIYIPKQYQPTKDLGYQFIIWTLYGFPGDNDAVVEEYKNMDLFAITMPQHRAKEGLAKMLIKPKIPPYVHTITNLDDAIHYQKKYRITSVYTVFLATDLPDPNVPQ